MKALKIAVILIVVIVIGGLGFLMISAMKAPEQFLEEFRVETAKISKNQPILAYPDELLEKKASLDARLAMSANDSIGMRINLKEQALYLEIQGIVLHKTTILDHKSSSFFKHLSAAEKYILFRKPLTISKDESTIEKDRFEIVIAPKDSLEAQAREEVIPDTILREPIMYRLYLQNGIRVQVTGRLHDSIPQFRPKFRFDFDDKKRYLKELTQSILKKTPAPYQPTLSITVEAREAEAIYRAVPKKGNVILEL